MWVRNFNWNWNLNYIEFTPFQEHICNLKSMVWLKGFRFHTQLFFLLNPTIFIDMYFQLNFVQFVLILFQAEIHFLNHRPTSSIIEGFMREVWKVINFHLTKLWNTNIADKCSKNELFTCLLMPSMLLFI